MADKLLCPFCGHHLGRKNINDMMCSNEKCVTWKGNFYGSEDLWRALIDTKKKLDVCIRGLDQMTWGCNSADAEDLLKQIKDKE